MDANIDPECATGGDDGLLTGVLGTVGEGVDVGVVDADGFMKPILILRIVEKMLPFPLPGVGEEPFTEEAGCSCL
jgi:hypothetical protein